MRKLFTLFVAILTTTALWAYDFYVSGICYNNLGGYRVEVASGYKRYQSHSYVDSIFIPSKVTYENVTFDVVGIGDEAFESNPNLGYTCNISYVFIPNSVTSIGNSAFSGCSGLTSIAIPNSVTSIGEYAFSSCSLTSITIPENVTSVGEYAFNCSSLTSVNWEAKNVDDCRISPFNNITSIIFGDNVKSIPKSVCYGCNSLSSVIISNSVNTIGLSAFRYCNSLTSVSMGNSVTNIEGCAFQYCTSLTSITLPNSVTSIGAQTFSGCTSLTSINIPNSVTSIGQYAFSGCSSLNSLILGEGVNSIGDYAFDRCTNIDTIYILADIPPTIDVSTLPSSIETIYVHAGVLHDYKVKWSGVADKIFPLPGEALFLTPITTKNKTQTTATINAIITNTDSTYSYNVGYLSKEDTVYLEYSDTLEFTVTDLYPNQSTQITLFVGKTNEPFDSYVFKQINVQTKSVTVSVQVPTTTQTTATITLSCNAGDATPIEQGIILTHPNGQIDTVPFEINQTDTIIRKLAPYSNYVATGYCIVKEGNQTFASSGKKFTTKDINVYVSTESKTQTTLHVAVQYFAGDATITDKGLIVHFPNGRIDTISIKNTYEVYNEIAGDTVFAQLRINSEYDMYGFVRTIEGGLKVGNGRAIYTKNIESAITSSNRTQTTISLSASLGLGDATDYNKNGLQWTVGSSNYETIYFKEGVYNLDTTLTHLSPNTQYAFRLFHYSVDETGKEYTVYGNTKTFTTSPVVLSEPSLQSTGQTYIEVQTSSAYGDATLLEEVVEVATSKYSTPEQRVAVAGRSNVIINNLMPDTKYYFRSVLTTQEAGTMQSEWYEATTKQITLATGDADGISNSSAFLHGTIDCDTMSRTEIGFEWKRSDAPSTVKPQRLLVVDRVDENLIFRLEGLSSDRYYDFRTFCLYNGKEYFGEWVGFLTSDKEILILPSVQTREAEVSEFGIEMKGFVVAGTEVILQRGFECWREESDQVATTVAEGAIMSSFVPEAWSYTTYKYRAYAKTASGTTYGETLSATSGYVITEIVDVIVNASSNSAQVTWMVVEQADYYILTLYSDESMTETIGVYTVDKNGNVTQKRVASALQSLVSCELTDLLPETNYYFAVKAYNNADQMVAEENGAFATKQTPTSIENVDNLSQTIDCQKVIRNGQLFILRDGRNYTIMGQEMK